MFFFRSSLKSTARCESRCIDQKNSTRNHWFLSKYRSIPENELIHESLTPTRRHNSFGSHTCIDLLFLKKQIKMIFLNHINMNEYFLEKTPNQLIIVYSLIVMIRWTRSTNWVINLIESFIHSYVIDWMKECIDKKDGTKERVILHV